MRKLLLASLILLPHEVLADCKELYARWDRLAASGEWQAVTAMPLDTQARLFGEAKYLVTQAARECGGMTPKAKELIQLYDGALEEIRQERRYYQDQAVDKSLVCVGWTGFMSCN